MRGKTNLVQDMRKPSRTCLGNSPINHYAIFNLVFGVGVSCRNLYFFVVYLYVSGSVSITSVGEERELICLLLFTCKYVVSVWRGFRFLWMLGMGYDILLWHSLSLPYNY